MSDKHVSLAIFLAVSVVFCGIAIPLMLKIIPPNWSYGWRTRTTVNNPDIWYPVNQIAGVWLFVTGDLVGAVAVWTYLCDFDKNTALWITLGALATGLTATIIHGCVVIRRLKK